MANLHMHPLVSKVRFELSRWLFVIGLALLCACALLIAGIWIKAATIHMLPHQIADYDRGNHGPWRYSGLRDFVWFAIKLPFFAGCAALLSWAIRPSSRAGLLVAVCLATLFIVTVTHFWLVD